MSIDYAIEKLSKAIYALAASAAPIQERLTAAFMSFHPIRPEEDIPDPELKSRYENIYEQFTKVSDPAAGSAAASMRVLSDDEASKLAFEIVELSNLLVLYDATAREDRAR
jgi:hypothetical protein